MEVKNKHFRHILLFYCRKGKNAAQSAEKLLDVYGEEALKDRKCRNWFDKFRSGDFSLKDEQRSGRPNEVDDGQIKDIIESAITSGTTQYYILTLSQGVGFALNYKKRRFRPTKQITYFGFIFN